MFLLEGRPCAVIVKQSHVKGADADAEAITWYVKGKGESRAQYLPLDASGQPRINRRSELIYFLK